MLGMLTLTGVSDTRLAGEERLETFLLQIVQQSYSGNIGIAIATGIVFSLTEYTGHSAKQFIVRQRAVFTNNVGNAKT
jgi:hypothetical protein